MKKSEITRQKILTAAEEAFAQKGLYGVRVDGICEAAGVNKRMIYEHFGSKEGLYIAVLDIVYNRISESEKEFLKTDIDVVDAIKNVIKFYFKFLSHNPTFVKMLMWENLNEAEFLKKSNAPSYKWKAIKLMRTVLSRGIEEGIFKKEIDVDELVLSINLFCFSYFSNIHTMTQVMRKDLHSEEMVGERCQHVIDMVLKYILKEGI